MFDESGIIFLLRTLSVATVVLDLIITAFSDRLVLTKKQCKIIILSFATAFAIIGYFNTEGALGEGDLGRHFYYMDQIRTSNISLFDFLFHNSKSIGGDGYTSLVSFNVLRYLCVKLSKHNELICAVVIFLDYYISGYLIMDWNNETSGRYKIDNLSLLVLLTFIPFANHIGNLRFGLCSVIMGLAAYLYLFKKKNTSLFILLSLIAATIHPAAVMTIIFVLIAKFGFGMIVYVSVFAIGLIARLVSTALLKSNIKYFRIIAQKYMIYTSENQYRASRAPLYTVLILICVFLILFILIAFSSRKENIFSSKTAIYNFLVIDMLFSLGNIGSYDMVIRPTVVLGSLTAVFCSRRASGMTSRLPTRALWLSTSPICLTATPSEVRAR